MGWLVFKCWAAAVVVIVAWLRGLGSRMGADAELEDQGPRR